MSFIEIGSSELRAAISPYGAALARVWLPSKPRSLVLGLENPEDYQSAPAAMGVIVGPIAGRISNSRVRLGDTTYHMPENTPPDCLHSGPDGVQNSKWHVDEQFEDRLTLSTHLASGACGLPGRRRLRATYHIDGHQLHLTIATTSDEDTFVNAANHAYWVLDDVGDLSAHQLQVFGSTYVETGLDLIPTGALLEMRGSDRDFSQFRCPVDGPPLDGTFVLSGETALILKSQASGVQLRVTTNQPGVVLYTGENLPSITAPSDTPKIAPFSGIAIETQGLPDAPNQPTFPPVLLRAGELMHQTTTYELSEVSQ